MINSLWLASERLSRVGEVAFLGFPMWLDLSLPLINPPSSKRDEDRGKAQEEQ